MWSFFFFSWTANKSNGSDERGNEDKAVTWVEAGRRQKVKKQPEKCKNKVQNKSNPIFEIVYLIIDIKGLRHLQGVQWEIIEARNHINSVLKENA